MYVRERVCVYMFIGLPIRGLFDRIMMWNIMSRGRPIGWVGLGA